MKLLAQGLVLTVPDRFHVVIIWSARKQKIQKMKKYGDVEKSHCCQRKLDLFHEGR